MRRSGTDSPRPPRGVQEVRSQVALELLLNGYAAGGALVVLRSLLLAIGVNRELWVGGAVYDVTAVFAAPLTFLPGASFAVIGELTMADLTLLAAVVLFPLALYLTGGRYGRYRSR